MTYHVQVAAPRPLERPCPWQNQSDPLLTEQQHEPSLESRQITTEPQVKTMPVVA